MQRDAVTFNSAQVATLRYHMSSDELTLVICSFFLVVHTTRLNREFQQAIIRKGKQHPSESERWILVVGT